MDKNLTLINFYTLIKTDPFQINQPQYKLRLIMPDKLPNILRDLLIIKLPLTMIIFVLALTSCTNNNPVLISINEENIDLNSFKKNYALFLKHTLRSDNLKNRYLQANTVIDEKLITQYALSKPKKYMESIHHKFEIVKKQLLLNGYYETIIKQKIKPEDYFLRKLFVWSKTTIQARHLFAKTNEEIQKINLRLESGESWEKIASETFQDKTLKSNGGNLGMINIGDMDPAFEVAAFPLKDGEISDPVKTAYGYSIIQVLGRAYEPLITEDNFQHELAFLNAHAMSLLSYPALDSHTKKLISELNIRFANNVLSRLWEHIKYSKQELLLSTPNEKLVTFGNDISWSVQECLSGISELSIRQKNNISSKKRMRLTIKGLIARNSFLEKSIILKIDETDHFKKELDRAKSHLLIQSVLSDKLSNKKNKELKRKEYFNFISGLRKQSIIEIDTVLIKEFIMPSDE